MKSKLYLSFLVFPLLLLAACQSQTETTEVQENSEPAVTAVPLEAQIELTTEDAPVLEPELTEGMDVELEMAPTATDIMPTEVSSDVSERSCEVSDSMHASNPEEFALASGQPQLVEFFAFW